MKTPPAFFTRCHIVHVINHFYPYKKLIEDTYARFAQIVQKVGLP
ncbi:MAG TPA: hypothetical protein VGP85_21425 [Pyrinomonadaceae bacterium]|nr:hypothetical protein [Pyrinomonadaceae bacterium]